MSDRPSTFIVVALDIWDHRVRHTYGPFLEDRAELFVETRNNAPADPHQYVAIALRVPSDVQTCGDHPAWEAGDILDTTSTPEHYRPS